MKLHKSRVLAAALITASTTVLAQGAAVPPLATLPPPPIPKDNPMTPAKVELGKKLFWEARLSGNGSMPCFWLVSIPSCTIATPSG